MLFNFFYYNLNSHFEKEIIIQNYTEETLRWRTAQKSFPKKITDVANAYLSGGKRIELGEINFNITVKECVLGQLRCERSGSQALHELKRIGITMKLLIIFFVI